MSSAPQDPRVGALLQRADDAARQNRGADAAALYEQVLTLAPHHPRALNALGNHALSAGDPAGARALFERAIRSDPNAPPLWLNLALAARAAGDDAAEIAALDRALAIDPYFLIAMIEKAQWFERHGDTDNAVRVYRGLVAAAPPEETLPPAFLAVLDHARRLVGSADDALYAAIRAALGDRGIGSQRIEHALEVLTNKRQVYVQKPVGLHIPYLPAIQFFDDALFPWFAALESATATIRDEFVALASTIDEQPYVQIAAGQPVNQWQALNHSLDWGARFLHKDGIELPEATARCPATTALMLSLPLLDIPGRGPTVMFSTLKPGAHIPPHHGVTNLRAVIHLPLIVPDGCRFRVGSETRAWQEGRAWAFDDTIEHEAWNDSAAPRAILIVDAWNPLLDDDERNLLRAAHTVLSAFGAGPG